MTHQELILLCKLEADDAKKRGRPLFTTSLAEDVRADFAEFLILCSKKFNADKDIIKAIIANKIYRLKKKEDL